MTERCDEIRVTAVQTGTANLQRLHETGTPARSPAERKLDILRDHEWAGPLPIFAYVVEHPEGTFFVDTGDRARNSDRDSHRDRRTAGSASTTSTRPPITGGLRIVQLAGETSVNAAGPDQRVDASTHT